MKPAIAPVADFYSHPFSLYRKEPAMKKSLSCQDLGAAACSFEASSENLDEITDAFFAHGKKYHPEEFLSMTEQQETDMAAMMEDRMKVISS
jgi:predicted small metal-binding protein